MNEMNTNDGTGYSIPIDADPISANPISVEPITIDPIDASDVGTNHTTYSHINQESNHTTQSGNDTQSFKIPDDVKLKQCKYCRVLIPKDAKICPNCKHRIKRKKLKTFFVSILILALCAGLGLAGYYYRYNITGAFSGFMHAANNRKPAAVAEVPTAPPAATPEPTVEPTVEPTATPEVSETPIPSTTPTELPKLGAYKDISKEDFMPQCIVPDFKGFLRNPKDYKGLYVKSTLQIEEIIKGTLFDKYTYYLCIDTAASSSDNRYLLRDVRTSGSTKLLKDDVIAVYGQFFSLCNVPSATLSETIEVPAVDLVFCDLIE